MPFSLPQKEKYIGTDLTKYVQDLCEGKLQSSRSIRTMEHYLALKKKNSETCYNVSES